MASANYIPGPFKKEVAKAKKRYYRDIIKDLKTSNVSQWFSKLKRLCSYDKIKTEPVVVDSIKHLDNQEQAEAIADKFAKVSQEYEPLQNSEIDIPDFNPEEIPVFKQEDVQKHLEKVKLKKAVPPGDLPPLLIRKFAKQISIPLCDIINFSVKYG